MSRRKGPFEPLYIYGNQIEYVSSMLYLGFEINRNGNLSGIMEDRIRKASRMSHMLLQGLRTNRNVSSKLAMSLFDKQIVPILLYGSSIWDTPKTHCLFYLEGQPEHLNTRNLVSNMLNSSLNRSVHFLYARRVGKRHHSTHRKILIKLKNYSDKLELFESAIESNYTISNFTEKESHVEKIHHDFCKKALNISKYASNTAVELELGRFPVSNVAKGLMIKYWLRLNAGTGNMLLNEAYSECKNNYYDWLQGIQFLLTTNGFGNVWNDPTSVNKENFHHYFRQRLNEIHIQNCESKISNSNRFSTLQILDAEFKMQNYILRVTDPEKREIVTRLRIDLNILSTCKGQLDRQQDLCPLCRVEPESVSHFILKCDRNSAIRTHFFDMISAKDISFALKSDQNKLKYFLNIECPNELLGICCNFLGAIYKQRLKDKAMST